MTSLTKRLVNRLTKRSSSTSRLQPQAKIPPQMKPEGPVSVEGLPEGRYFATLGELAEDYGGTTSVVIHRSKVFVEQTGKPVDILTFGHLRDYYALNELMLEDGRFVPGLRFRNMWAELSAMWSEPSTQRSYDDFSPLTDSTADEVIHGLGVPIRRFRKSKSGANLQIDLCREDGSVIVSDRRDLNTEGGKRRSSVVLCDGRGRPVVEFDSIMGLRNYWLDSVIREDQAFLFSDTFGVAGFTHQYKRKNVVLIQTFHNNHLKRGATSALDYTDRRYPPFLDNVDDFDATVVLTHRQKDDLDVLMGSSPQRWVIPNSRPNGTAALTPRQRELGITVGRLVAGKQIDHAVKAVAAANGRLESKVSLDIYGDGSAYESIRRLIADTQNSTVRLLGYDPSAADKFSEASFSLLTSRSEAMSLVLVESMSRGCVPIAYDVAYGPGEIIAHGVNGFLVEPNSVEAIADSIVELQSMDSERLESMRDAARARARDFSDESITKLWSKLLRRTVAQRRVPERLYVSECMTLFHKNGEAAKIRVRFKVSRPLHEPRVHIVLRSRADPAITRIEAQSIQRNSNYVEVDVDLIPDRIAWIERGIVDAYMEVHDESGRGQRRLPASEHLRSGNKLQFASFTVYATQHGSLSFKHH